MNLFVEYFFEVKNSMSDWMNRMDEELNKERNSEKQERQKKTQEITQSHEYKRVSRFVGAYSAFIISRLRELGEKRGKAGFFGKGKYELKIDDHRISPIVTSDVTYHYTWCLSINRGWGKRDDYIFVVDDARFIFLTPGYTNYFTPIDSVKNDDVLHVIGSGYKYGPSSSFDENDMMG